MQLKSFILLLLLASQVQLFAVDRIVQEMGPTGTYGSISDAVSAAVDGDRIVIHNRLSGFIWNENITVSKSLTFTSVNDTARVKLFGDMTIAPSAAGKEVTVMRMEMMGGGIRANTDAPAGSWSKVTILDSEINGDIYFYYGNFDVTVSHCDVIGDIWFGFGQVLGNNVNGRIIAANPSNPPTNEVISIIGNKVSSTASQGIVAASPSYFVEILNNLVESADVGISIEALKSGSVKQTKILNNSIFAKTGVYSFSTSATGADLQIQNNAMKWVGSGVSRAFWINLSAGNLATIAYNRAQNFGLTDFVPASTIGMGTNTTTSVDFILQSDGSTYGTGAVDSGNPDAYYYDHDLTRNDLGTQGGSYSIVNYFPRPIGKAPRVIFVGSPRVEYVGNPIDINAEGFDK